MNMKLEFVELAGFRGFRDKTRFDIPSGFMVLSGHNGTGKSTVLDAIDFAITGTINKFSVREAKGGGLDEHIWWVGPEKAEAHYVSIGFVGNDNERFVVTRDRERGCNVQLSEIFDRLCSAGTAFRASAETLMQTNLIRDEFISALSLDLPEQTRFALVRDAIGNMVGPDYSARTNAIFDAATAAKNKQEERIKDLQNELGRVLGEITEARSLAERSADISEALRVIESLAISLPQGLTERTETLRKLITQKRIALQQIERTRSQALELQPELLYFDSPDAKATIDAARLAVETSSREKQFAEERLTAAARLHEVERTSDEYAAHMAALLDHGEAVGLQDGHCPLCNAPRNLSEFELAIAAARTRLASRGEKLSASAAALTQARSTLVECDKAVSGAQNRLKELESRQSELTRKLTAVRESYLQSGFTGAPDDPDAAQKWLFAEQENIVRLERALGVLETSNAVDRVKTLESRIASLRERNDQEAAKLAALERAVEASRQLEAAAKTVKNEILTEQFDTVMPLLKELYRRLRPHADWTEIESDFGGKIRGSLNFVVGDGYNPQFLFSSGQRRAAGLAFLLAVHLSRPWCSWQSLLLDDPVQHIDDYRALNLVEVLAAIRRANRQVIVAVEDPALADLLCRRLRSASGDMGRIFELRTSKTGSAEFEAKRDVYPMPQLVLRASHAS
jgi:chromosome segregation protein